MPMFTIAILAPLSDNTSIASGTVGVAIAIAVVVLASRRGGGRK
ncbi:MAG: hypothetical protein ACJAQ3_003171 [Planctomycetota bacterium]